MNFNTPNGKVMREGEILIAVKPGCTNLMICDSVFTGSDYQQVRFPGQAVPEHARMILTLSMFRGLEKRGGKKGGGKDKPDDCTPDDPHHGGGG